MGISWSGIRKQLEEEWLCPALRGRVRYFVTRYRKSHDQEGRVAVLVDGREVLRSCYYDWMAEHVVAYQQGLTGRDAFLRVRARGGFEQHSFYNAFYTYQNQSIDRSLADENALVRLLAVLDRRVGATRLRRIREALPDQPDWLQPFYRLRLEAEHVPLTEKEPVAK